MTLPHRRARSARKSKGTFHDCVSFERHTPMPLI
jgi:hypothetical protein